MIAEPTGDVNPETGKTVYKFLRSVKNMVKSQTDAEKSLRDYGALFSFYDSEMYGDFSRFDVDISTGEVLKQYSARKLIILPCGQCLDCRCRHAQEWANRIMLESQYHDEAYFVTLTYDENHVPVVMDTLGDPVYTLKPKDLQDFIKRLRRQQEYHKSNTIRYYAVGEYGSVTHRPHYHAIIFGLKLDDLLYIGRNKHGTPLHDSPKLREIWGKGLTEVDRMTWESAAYCARYTVKKLGKKESDFYKEHNLIPEFSRMSLKPAIGYQYFDENKEKIYDLDEIFISTSKGGRKVKPPKYYDLKYDDIYPAQMAEIKGNRMDIAEKATIARLAQFGGSYLELLKMNEENMKNRNKKLRRNLQ